MDKMKILIKGSDINIRKMTPEELEVYLREKKRGAGAHKKKKGNGSYNRKGRKRNDE